MSGSSMRQLLFIPILILASCCGTRLHTTNALTFQLPTKSLPICSSPTTTQIVTSNDCDKAIDELDILFPLKDSYYSFTRLENPPQRWVQVPVETHFGSCWASLDLLPDRRVSADKWRPIYEQLRELWGKCVVDRFDSSGGYLVVRVPEEPKVESGLVVRLCAKSIL